jgi:hypothetical protein
LNPDQSERSGILAGGNWIVDRTKMIDVYPAQDSLANIIRETSSNGGSPYKVLINLADFTQSSAQRQSASRRVLYDSRGG